MTSAARLLPLLAAIFLTGGCRFLGLVAGTPAAPASATIRAIGPSPRLIVGRVLAIDPRRGFAFVDLGSDAPPAALAAGTELIARTGDLQETARLRTSRHLRGRTLGATVISGQPSPGDEVVWHAP